MCIEDGYNSPFKVLAVENIVFIEAPTLSKVNQTHFQIWDDRSGIELFGNNFVVEIGRKLRMVTNIYMVSMNIKTNLDCEILESMIRMEIIDRKIYEVVNKARCIIPGMKDLLKGDLWRMVGIYAETPKADSLPYGGYVSNPLNLLFSYPPEIVSIDPLFISTGEDTSITITFLNYFSVQNLYCHSQQLGGKPSINLPIIQQQSVFNNNTISCLIPYTGYNTKWAVSISYFQHLSLFGEKFKEYVTMIDYFRVLHLNPNFLNPTIPTLLSFHGINYLKALEYKCLISSPLDNLTRIIDAQYMSSTLITTTIPQYLLSLLNSSSVQVELLANASGIPNSKYKLQILDSIKIEIDEYNSQIFNWVFDGNNILNEKLVIKGENLVNITHCMFKEVLREANVIWSKSRYERLECEIPKGEIFGSNWEMIRRGEVDLVEKSGDINHIVKRIYIWFVRSPRIVNYWFGKVESINGKDSRIHIEGEYLSSNETYMCNIQSDEVVGEYISLPGLLLSIDVLECSYDFQLLSQSPRIWITTHSLTVNSLYSNSISIHNLHPLPLNTAKTYFFTQSPIILPNSIIINLNILHILCIFTYPQFALQVPLQFYEHEGSLSVGEELKKYGFGVLYETNEMLFCRAPTVAGSNIQLSIQNKLTGQLRIYYERIILISNTYLSGQVIQLFEGIEELELPPLPQFHLYLKLSYYLIGNEEGSGMEMGELGSCENSHNEVRCGIEKGRRGKGFGIGYKLGEFPIAIQMGNLVVDIFPIPVLLSLQPSTVYKGEHPFISFVFESSEGLELVNIYIHYEEEGVPVPPLPCTQHPTFLNTLECDMSTTYIERDAGSGVDIWVQVNARVYKYLNMLTILPHSNFYPISPHILFLPNWSLEFMSESIYPEYIDRLYCYIDNLFWVTVTTSLSTPGSYIWGCGNYVLERGNHSVELMYKNITTLAIHQFQIVPSPLINKIYPDIHNSVIPRLFTLVLDQALQSPPEYLTHFSLLLTSTYPEQTPRIHNVGIVEAENNWITFKYISNVGRGVVRVGIAYEGVKVSRNEGYFIQMSTLSILKVISAPLPSHQILLSLVLESPRNTMETIILHNLTSRVECTLGERTTQMEIDDIYSGSREASCRFPKSGMGGVSEELGLRMSYSEYSKGEITQNWLPISSLFNLLDLTPTLQSITPNLGYVGRNFILSLTFGNIYSSTITPLHCYLHSTYIPLGYYVQATHQLDSHGLPIYICEFGLLSRGEHSLALSFDSLYYTQQNTPIYIVDIPLVHYKMFYKLMGDQLTHLTFNVSSINKHLQTLCSFQPTLGGVRHKTTATIHNSYFLTNIYIYEIKCPLPSIFLELTEDIWMIGLYNVEITQGDADSLLTWSSSYVSVEILCKISMKLINPGEIYEDYRGEISVYFEENEALRSLEVSPEVLGCRFKGIGESVVSSISSNSLQCSLPLLHPTDLTLPISSEVEIYVNEIGLSSNVDNIGIEIFGLLGEVKLSPLEIFSSSSGRLYVYSQHMPLEHTKYSFYCVSEYAEDSRREESPALWDSTISRFICNVGYMGIGEYKIGLRMNNLPIAPASTTLYFRPPLTITQLHPPNGPTEGGTQIFINGHNLMSVQGVFGVHCIFNESKYTIAEVINDNLLKCKSHPAPRLGKTRLHFGILDSFHSTTYSYFQSNSLLFEYEAVFAVTQVQPVAIIPGSPIYVETSSNRLSQYTYTCRFTPTLSEVPIYTGHGRRGVEGVIACPTEGLDDKYTIYELQISSNSVDFSAPIEIVSVREVEIMRVYPEICYMEGGTRIGLSIENAPPTAHLLCLFGENSTSAAWREPLSAYNWWCRCPERGVNEVSDDNYLGIYEYKYSIHSRNRLPFTYIAAPTITSFSPSILYLSPLPQTVTISGTSFLSGGNSLSYRERNPGERTLWINLGYEDIQTECRVLSDSECSFLLPPISTGITHETLQVHVSLSYFHDNFPSPSSYLSIQAIPWVSAISPSTMSTHHRNRYLWVLGGNYPLNDINDIYHPRCLFEKEEVNIETTGVVINSTHILCDNTEMLYFTGKESVWVSVNLGGVLYKGGVLTFTGGMHILTISPEYGSITGGTAVTLLLNTPLSDQLFFCKEDGDIIGTAKRITSTEYECLMPPAASPHTSFLSLISHTGVEIYSGLRFNYVQDISIHRLSPLILRMDTTDIAVTVTGKGFQGVDPMHSIDCRLSSLDGCLHHCPLAARQHTVKAQVLSNTELICLYPQESLFQATGAIQVILTAHKLEYLAQEEIIIYEVPIIEEAEISFHSNILHIYGSKLLQPALRMHCVIEYAIGIPPLITEERVPLMKLGDKERDHAYCKVKEELLLESSEVWYQLVIGESGKGEIGEKREVRNPHAFPGEQITHVRPLTLSSSYPEYIYIHAHFLRTTNSNGEYACQIGAHITTATVESSVFMKCLSYPMSPGQHLLNIYNQHTQLLYTTNIFFAQPLMLTRVTRVQLNTTDLLAFRTPNLQPGLYLQLTANDITMDCTCYLNNYLVNQHIYLSSEKIICSLKNLKLIWEQEGVSSSSLGHVLRISLYCPMFSRRSPNELLMRFEEEIGYEGFEPEIVREGVEEMSIVIKGKYFLENVGLGCRIVSVDGTNANTNTNTNTNTNRIIPPEVIAGIVEYVSVESILCKLGTAPYESAHEKFSVQVDPFGQNLFEEVSVTKYLRVMPRLELHSLSPKTITKESGYKLSVMGKGFGNIHIYRCVFNDYLQIEAVYINSTHLQCTTPYLNFKTSTALVEVAEESSFDHVIQLSNSLSIQILPPVTIHLISPNYAPHTGGYPLTITGNHFVTGHTYLKFSDSLIVKGQVIDPQTLTLHTPSFIRPDIYTIQISNIGKTFHIQTQQTAKFRAILMPVLKEVIPNVISTSGNQIITIIGENLTSAVDKCIIGDEETDCIYISDNILKCSTVSHLDGESYGLRVKYGGLYISSSELEVIYRAEFFVYSINPESIVKSGGTKVTLACSRVLPENNYCKFGDEAVVPAVRVSEKELYCVSPLLHTQENTCFVEILTPDSSFSNSRISIQLLEHFELKTIAPNLGPTTGGTLLNIFGSNFNSLVLYYCKFLFSSGDLLTTTTFLDSQNIRCLTPPIHYQSDVNIVLTTSTSHLSLGTGLFKYFVPPQITNFMPKLGTIRGGTTVLIYGTGFVQYDTILCKFGDVGTIIHATPILTNEIIQCVTLSSQSK